MKNMAAYLHFKESFIVIFVTVLLMVFIAPLILKGYHSHLLLQISLNLMILYMVYLLRLKRIMLYLGVALAFPFVILNWMSIIRDSMFIMTLSYIFFCLFLAFVLAILSKIIFNKKEVDINIIFGALIVYFLAGILWAKLYWIAEAFYPGSFKGVSSLDISTAHLDMALQSQFDLLYYSFTTLATLGLGDITPLHHLAKSLTILETMFGQLFVAIVIAKMVTIWRPDNNVKTQ